jgi:glutamate synthase (NADPH) large chain
VTSAAPAKQGLYDPAFEHDACGVAFLADIAGRVSHDTVEQGLQALRNLEHRGASGSEPETGDGAGILVQVPDAFLRPVLAEAGIDLPPVGSYAIGTAFLADDDAEVSRVQQQLAAIAAEEGLQVLGWRDLPVDPDGAGIGRTARSVMPRFAQVVLASATDGMTSYALERRAYVTRKRAEHETGTYFASLSTRTLVYKGMLTTGQLQPFFPDLSDERFASALALVHSRFSTNTFPSWPLAHPYRYIAHNGEINTVKGNRNWMRAREALLRGPSHASMSEEWNS